MKLHPGGSDSRNDPGVRLVYSDNTHRAEHAHMRPLNEWQILELGHFEDGNFEKKKFSPLGVLEQHSRA